MEELYLSDMPKRSQHDKYIGNSLCYQSLSANVTLLRFLYSCLVNIPEAEAFIL